MATLDENVTASGRTVAGPDAPAAAGGARSAWGEPGRVVVAEDDAGRREYLERLLGARHQVRVYADGGAALAEARADPPDLLVSGVMLPGRHGRSLLSEWRADPATARIPVLLLSTDAERDDALGGLAGTDDWLTVPFAAAELMWRVAQLVRLNRARQVSGVAGSDPPVERSVAEALQQTMLPEALPVLPGLRCAAQFLIGGKQSPGGDWLDAVPLPDRRVALVVGDAVGGGLSALAGMGQLRAVITALLLEGHELGDALARLDRFVADTGVATASTLCVAVLDPAEGTVTYASCGHPPPLLITQGGEARYLPVRRGGPLGTASRRAEPDRAQLAPGDLLLLFTDGLLRGSDRALAEGLAQLPVHAAAALARASPLGSAGDALDLFCREVMDRMTRRGHDDDVALIAAQRLDPAPTEFRAEVEARPRALAGLREQLGRWLASLGAHQRDVEGVQLAVGEAVTNAVDHAYPAGRPGPVSVEGYLDSTGRVCMTVSDRGVWRPPAPGSAARSRGMTMIRACMDTVEIDHSGSGTTVLMDRRLRVPLVLRTAVARAPDALNVAFPPPWFAAQARRGPQPRLTLTGPVDAATVERLRRAVDDAGRGGTLPLEIDLTGVTQLASTGVALLHELAEQMAADQLALRLIAPPGSPAHYVLQLAVLDHLIADPPEGDR